MIRVRFLVVALALASIVVMPWIPVEAESPIRPTVVLESERELVLTYSRKVENKAEAIRELIATAKQMSAEKNAQYQENIMAETEGGVGTLGMKYLSGYDSEDYGNGEVILDWDTSVNHIGWTIAASGDDDTFWTGDLPQWCVSQMSNVENLVIGHEGGNWYSCPTGWSCVGSSASKSVSANNVTFLYFSFTGLNGQWSCDPGDPECSGIASLTNNSTAHHYFVTTGVDIRLYAQDFEILYGW